MIVFFFLNELGYSNSWGSLVLKDDLLNPSFLFEGYKLVDFVDRIFENFDLLMGLRDP